MSAQPSISNGHVVNVSALATRKVVNIVNADSECPEGEVSSEKSHTNLGRENPPPPPPPSSSPPPQKKKKTLALSDALHLTDLTTRVHQPASVENVAASTVFIARAAESKGEPPAPCTQGVLKIGEEPLPPPCTPQFFPGWVSCSARASSFFPTPTTSVTPNPPLPLPPRPPCCCFCGTCFQTNATEFCVGFCSNRNGQNGRTTASTPTFCRI